MATTAPKKKQDQAKTAGPEAKTGGVMAKLRAEKAKKNKKASDKATLATGRKGAERPAEDEATEDRKRQLAEKSGGAQEERQGSHFADTAQRRIMGHAGARGRKSQARRDQRV